MKDQIGRTISILSPPKRIVSLVPSQTELLCYLGLEDSLVGITKFCVHPNHLLKTKTIVGGTKTVHFNKILELKPDIILCNKEENTKEMIQELEHIAPVHISDVYTIIDSLQLTKMYGELFSKTKEASQIIAEIKKLQINFKALMLDKPKVRVAYFIWKNPYMVIASKNFIDDMVSINNFENVFQDLERYPQITLDQLLERKPEVILLSSEPFPFKHKDVLEFQNNFPNTKIKIVDGEMFSWYGARIIKAFHYFEELRKEI